MQSKIVYNIIKPKNNKYAELVLLFFELLATYPKTMELIIIAIITNTMLNGFIKLSIRDL